LREKAVGRSPEVRALRDLLADTCTELGSVLVAAGRAGEAAAHYRRALELRPHSLAAKVNLAWSLALPRTATRQEAAEAVALARRAADEAPGVWNCWNALGAALYRMGEWEQARQALEKALALGKSCPPPPHL